MLPLASIASGAVCLEVLPDGRMTAPQYLPATFMCIFKLMTVCLLSSDAGRSRTNATASGSSRLLRAEFVSRAG